LPRKLPNFVEALPGVLLPLEPLDALRLRFFGWICHKNKKPTASLVYWRWAMIADY
jgi:hypothetical protein